jgi:ABC-type sulfate/molybdate transport systems ATPase subunit
MWLYFPSCIIGTRNLTVFPIMHQRNTKVDCISHHALKEAKSRVPLMHDGKYSQISCSYNTWWEIQSNFVFLWFMMGNTVKSRVPLMHDGKYSQISCSFDAWWEIQSNVVFLWCMMGNTVKIRVPMMHDGKYSQISCSYDAWWEIQSTFVFLLMHDEEYSQISSITQISRFPGKFEIGN